MAANEKITPASERALELITAVQESILDATKSYISTLSGTSPNAPSWADAVSTPTPDAKELIEENYKFQSRLLEANKSFALALTELWTQAASSVAPGAKAAATGADKK
jgi:hypothetical protein